MGLCGAMKVSNVPLYQELARRIGLQGMREAIARLGYGNQQIGTNVTTFWLRGPLAINDVEQTRFLSALAYRTLPFPAQAQRQVAEITRVDSGTGPACQDRLAERSGARRGTIRPLLQHSRRIY